MTSEDLDGYTHKEYVLKYFPTAYSKDINNLYRVMVDVNELSSWQEVACNLTEEQAWEDAAEWVYDESYYIEQKKNKKK